MNAETETVTEIETTEMRVRASGGYVPFDEEEDGDDSRADAGTRTREEVDAALSNRFIALDPVGYFLIAVDRERMEICASHHANVIGEDGRARDPRTGEVIPCDGSYEPPPPTRFRGRTAKELSVEILERGDGAWCSMMSHANYLGREFQRAEACMTSGDEYVQD